MKEALKIIITPSVSHQLIYFPSITAFTSKVLEREKKNTGGQGGVFSCGDSSTSFFLSRFRFTSWNVSVEKYKNTCQQAL